jgi:phosphatidylglycerol:prolipoprotein diacylglycerol transferase
LDAGTPAFFLGVAVGRLGCFLTGCCAGRCTRAPWGVWSSDRRIGARRIPTQLIESVAGLLLGAASLLLFVLPAASVPGAIFVGGAAAYVLVRHWLLPLRAEPRQFSVAAPLTAAAAALVLAADAVVLFVGAV